MPAATRTLAFALFLSGVLLVGPAIAADCPTNLGRIGHLQGCASAQSTAPIFSLSHPPSGCVGSAGGTVSYDLIAGSIAASAFTLDHVSMTNSMRTSDVFVIAGAPSATPIAFTAILHVNRSPRGLARLTVGSATVQTTDPGPAAQSLRLDLAMIPGEPFTVGMYAETVAFAFNGSQMNGSLMFTPLPPGYSLTSCQGYATAPVATRTVSWGRVKQFYR